MKFRKLATAASTLALGLATLITPSKAQGPLYDTVYVNMPYTVTVGDKVLQPGDYVIKEMESQNKSRVLLIYSDHGRKFEASTMTFPCYDVQTLDTTKIVLHHFGPDYYFDKVWIEGKNYGYEFPLPNSVKQRNKERMQAVTVAARYEATAPPVAAAAPTPSVAQAAPSPAPAPTPEAATPAPTVAQASPSPAPAQQLPTTSADWLLMLLSGGGLSGAGLLLRRKA